MSDNIANFHVWLDARNEHIKLLRKLAAELDEVQKWLDIAKIVSTAASIVSGVGSVVCFALAVPTGGISVIPGYIVGGSGACNLGISIGADVFEKKTEKDLMKKVQNALDKDRRESVVVKKKDISNIQMARTCHERVSAVNTDINIVAKLAKNKARKELPANVSKYAARVGCVLNLLILPLDISILVKTSIKAKNGSTHEEATKIRGIIKQLEDERDQRVNGS
ncbi:hypothetical protein KP79_PYT12600 [Mizuhopecten yessoensis]|uniref:Apolipoprotein L3 n=1 Tax=Mizuhopecten yessoensis TaxID=6573 RepID=A0A210Q544_MIZYE|nr:hypothetical protein KP79_PYT12600 [Mizuhopecten yessoensis]